MLTEKIIISKSAKRKMTSGDRVKAGIHTQMVVYKSKDAKGIMRSKTKHELLNSKTK